MKADTVLIIKQLLKLGSVLHSSFSEHTCSIHAKTHASEWYAQHGQNGCLKTLHQHSVLA